MANTRFKLTVSTNNLYSIRRLLRQWQQIEIHVHLKLKHYKRKKIKLNTISIRRTKKNTTCTSDIKDKINRTKTLRRSVGATALYRTTHLTDHYLGLYM